ncbi:MAG: 6,7-dimethyl-8-ribityllumazine synthase [Bacteroidaceae bacterium]|nr:6,7-dimethyl-8-ribityllumazine synthase [Bacteroidaceae bacterium]MBQ1633788.1 6,7-dimethyl-8-ribityllumazine synthase [Bacteroidaceae bacterium]MBQ2185908.1 6,7-dimethyl-8-ribityllumazine synthase [Bacteroidaceae bacterium]MBQ2342278.1 6,7-dimethyl-8-ribityllumazine synthase [Bacteroidaceae bacterium]MBQ6085353.1 6,7-dimethyl-8-ribityllumazine synthase [Bacteroidaceae bacterium]
MASSLHNLSDYDINSVPSAEDMRFGIVVSEWNNNITSALLQGAYDTLLRHGAKEENIRVMTVPGSFELVYGSSQMVKSGKVDAVIAIGCVIRGDTPHFDYICQGATYGLSKLNLQSDVPVIYGLLTCNNHDQAEARCGGILGNKGDECAITAIKMVSYRRNL